MRTDASPIVPPPGSDLALAAGCLCPVIDNRHGAGMYEGPSGPIFCVSSECPLHGLGVLVLPDDPKDDPEG